MRLRRPAAPETTYAVTGLTCEHCVRAVTGELSGLPGVRRVTVDLVPDGRSTVRVTGTTALDAETIARALDEAGGYELVS